MGAAGMEEFEAALGAPGRDEFWRLRVATLAAGCVLALLAVSGVLASTLFTQPTTIKYLVTVAGSLLLIMLATVREPLRLLVGVAIVVAPFDFVTSAAGFQITPLVAVVVLAVLVWLPRAPTAGRPSLRPMPWIFVLALVPALAGSDAVGSWTVWLAATVATGCLAFVVASEPGGPRFIASALALSGLIQGALAIWEFRTGHQLNLYQQAGAVTSGSEYFFTYGRLARPSGALPDPIGLGQVLALCIPMMIALAVSFKRWTLSIAVLLATGLAAVALLLSLSRASIVATGVGIVVVVLLLPRRLLVARGVALVAIAVAVAVFATSLGGRSLSQRLNTVLHPTASHVSTAAGDLARIHIWNAALKTAEANLVAGVGLGNITKDLPKYGVPVTPAGNAQDTYLQFFAEGGLLGLAAIVAVIAAAAVDLRRGFAWQRIWVAGAAGSLVATLLSWLTDVEVRYVQVSAMVAVLLGLIAALARQPRSDAQRWRMWRAWTPGDGE